ncbi:uncharacterized protein LOC144611063 [Rhinoraja longicauda]
MNYIQIGIKKTKPLPKDGLIRPVAHSRIIASARFRKFTQEPCIICVVANGDLLSPAIRLLIPKRVLCQWEQVLASITEKVNLRTGAVRRLHTLDGRSVNDGSELENGGYYVAVGRDKFKKLPYNELIFDKSYPRRTNRSKAASLPPIPGSKKNKENGDRQIRSTGTESEVSPLMLSQSPKRKGKKEQVLAKEESVFHAKPGQAKPDKNGGGSPTLDTENESCVFKAFEDRRETLDAMEIQEDNLTQVELPIDQRPAEIVEEEELLQERSKKGGDNERDGRFQKVGEEIGNDVLTTEGTPTPGHLEGYPRSQADPGDKVRKGKASEAGPRAEEGMAEGVKDGAQPGENPKGGRPHPRGLPQKGKTIEDIEAGPRVEELIDGLAKQGKDGGGELQTEGSPNAKYFSPQDPPRKAGKTIDESKAGIQVEEDVDELAGKAAEIANLPGGSLQGKGPPPQLGLSLDEDTIEESEPELQGEEELSDLAEQEAEGAGQGEGTGFPPQEVLEEEEKTADESDDDRLEEEVADFAEEEGANQVQEDCEDLELELEDSSVGQEAPLEEIESEIRSALEAGQDDDNLEEILESAAESPEADGNEILQAAAGLALLAL